MRHYRPDSAAVVLAVLLILLSVKSLAVDDSWPAFDNVVYTNPAVNYTIGKLSFTDCRLNDPGFTHYRNMQCSFLRVPENYQQPDGSLITLFVGRIPATGKRPDPDPLIPFQGGPGGAASDLFIINGIGLDRIQQQRDLIIVDQRGTGKSMRLDCPSLAESTMEFNLERVKTATRTCLTSLEGDPAQYTTSVAVKDFDRVREALEIDRWNLYGVSYGTRVAQHYLRRYPDRVRTVILDAVVPPQVSLGPEIALESQRALQQLFQRCKASPSCDSAFPKLEEGVASLFAQLAEAPIQFQYEDIGSGHQQSATLYRGHLIAVVRLSLYSSASAAILPVLLHEAYANHNYAPLYRNAMQMDSSVTGSISIGMHNSVICAEDEAFLRDSDIDFDALKASYIGEEHYAQLRAMCAPWPLGPVDDDLKKPVASDKPVLLLSGTADPITPPAYAELAMQKLTNSQHIIAEGLGHGLAAHGCMPTILARFVESASLEGLKADCMTKQKPEPIFIDFNGPTP